MFLMTINRGTIPDSFGRISTLTSFVHLGNVLSDLSLIASYAIALTNVICYARSHRFGGLNRWYFTSFYESNDLTADSNADWNQRFVM